MKTVRSYFINTICKRIMKMKNKLYPRSICDFISFSVKYLKTKFTYEPKNKDLYYEPITEFCISKDIKNQ